MRIFIVCLFAIGILKEYTVYGYIETQFAEVAQECCIRGTSFASTHSVSECSNAELPTLSPLLGSICSVALKQCCEAYYTKKKDCDEGIDIASKHENCEASVSDTGRKCCAQCEKGQSVGKVHGPCEMETNSSSVDELLPIDAFIGCCVNTSNGSKNFESSFQNTLSKSNQLRTGSSICDLYAPNELCAHHCIALPGSYKCECNPGYKLMADGKNCMALKRNRCKEHNPCQHKCKDNGEQVKCSCRRGYRLLKDGKSCEDIDECKLIPPVCFPGTQCNNILGSYKCMPGKKVVSAVVKCPPGFMRNSVTNVCDDINECNLLHPPCPKYLCENTIGGYKCGGLMGDPSNLATNTHPMEDQCPPGFKSGRNEECEDVDECTTKKDNCNSQSEFCINTIGSFFCQDKESKRCPPGFKINDNNNRCEDIDECQEMDSQSLCRGNKVCVNVPGAYDCKTQSAVSSSASRDRNYPCPEGMRVIPGSSICEDIDECMEGTHLCDQYQICQNTNSSYECKCKAGFKLDPTTGACEDINECLTDDNDCLANSQRCDNTIGSYLCIRLLSCGTGYILQHSSGKCEDIDECATGRDNCARAGKDYVCHNLPGSFRCIKKEPEYEDEYYYDSGEEEEVSEKSPVTPKPETTTSTTTTLKPSIFYPSSTQRSTTEKRVEENYTIYKNYPEPDINEAPKIDPRIPEATSPEPTAEPKKEEEEQQTTAEPTKPTIDIPTEDRKSSVTKPTEPIETKPDYYPIPEETPSYSEPKENVPDQATPHIVELEVTKETAIVTPERTEDGTVVVDLNNIPKNTWTKINRHPEPVVCQTGFELNDNDACDDIDECQTDKHVCSGLTEICHNTMGGYYCDCGLGFQRDPVTGACDLISQTTSSTTTEAPSSTTEDRMWGYPIYRNRAEPRPFRPRFQCNVGYQFNHTTAKCEDIDECTNGNANCGSAEVCANTEGGWRCDCLPSWTYDNTKHRCVPNRGKSKIPPGYGNVPGREEVPYRNRNRLNYKHTLNPTYTKFEGQGALLKCRHGYELNNDNICEDIDECAVGIANCGPDQICTNQPGGYVCACPLGHRLIGDHLCEDIDECALAGNTPICSKNAECINTVGSYQCKCHQGFRNAPANDKVCLDVDECQDSRQGSLCMHTCNNILGGYRCSCYRGYRLNSDNRTCSDIDECTEFKNSQICIGKCHNEPGNYRCSCPSGYRLAQDNRTCIDIDECETGEAICSSSTRGDFCLNIRGGYKCENINCPPGYKLEGKHRCNKIDNYCLFGDYDCIHKPSTYSFNYITFVSNLQIEKGRIDLYTMNVQATWPKASKKFGLRVINVDAPPTVKRKATIDSFLLTTTNVNAVVSIVESLEGPQTIELELKVQLFSGDEFARLAVAKIFIIISEYAF